MGSDIDISVRVPRDKVAVKEPNWMVIPGTPWVTELFIDREGPQPGLKSRSFIKLEGGFGRSYWKEGRRDDSLHHGGGYFTIKLTKEEAALAGIPTILFDLDELNEAKVSALVARAKKEGLPGVQLRTLYAELNLGRKAEQIDGWGSSWGAQIALKL